MLAPYAIGNVMMLLILLSAWMLPADLPEEALQKTYDGWLVLEGIFAIVIGAVIVGIAPLMVSAQKVTSQDARGITKAFVEKKPSDKRMRMMGLFIMIAGALMVVSGL